MISKHTLLSFFHVHSVLLPFNNNNNSNKKNRGSTQSKCMLKIKSNSKAKSKGKLTKMSSGDTTYQQATKNRLAPLPVMSLMS